MFSMYLNYLEYEDFFKKKKADKRDSLSERR